MILARIKKATASQNDGAALECGPRDPLVPGFTNHWPLGI